MSSIFVIGNGESRNNVDLSSLPRTYGCNALYRDFTPDVLVCVDNAMVQEIYSSGYCKDNNTWMRVWDPLPGEMSEIMRVQCQGAPIKESERGDRNQFVLHGDEHRIYITWVDDEDKVKVIENKEIEKWCSGTTAVRLACEENPEIIYMIGFDLGSTNGTVNNVYKNTACYVKDGTPEHVAHSVVQWMPQHKKNFVDFPNIEFRFVHPDLRVRERLEDGVGILDNVVYMESL